MQNASTRFERQRNSTLHKVKAIAKLLTNLFCLSSTVELQKGSFIFFKSSFGVPLSKVDLQSFCNKLTCLNVKKYPRKKEKRSDLCNCSVLARYLSISSCLLVEKYFQHSSLKIGFPWPSIDMYMSSQMLVKIKCVKQVLVCTFFHYSEIFTFSAVCLWWMVLMVTLKRQV